MYLFGCLYTPSRIQLLSKSQGKQWLAAYCVRRTPKVVIIVGIMPLFIPFSATKSAIRLRMRIFKKNKDSLAKSMNFNSIWLQNRLYYSQIEQFSFDLAIECLADYYYHPGLRAFELSARAVQFFKTCTGKILRIWGISSKKILRIWGNFRQKDFEEKNILCIFAPNCNINK